LEEEEEEEEEEDCSSVLSWSINLKKQVTSFYRILPLSIQEK